MVNKVLNIKHRRLLGCLFLIPLIMLNACMTVGPDFSQPTVKTNSQFKPTTSTDVTVAMNESSDQHIDPVQWWESFGDSTLNQLLQKVKAQNLSLQQSALRVYQYQSYLGISDSQLLPTVALSGSTTTSKNSALQQITNNSNNLVLNSVSLQLNWELDFWGKYRRSIESSYSNYLSSVAAYYSADVSISADVANTYINIRNYESMIDVAKTNLVL